MRIAITIKKGVYVSPSGMEDDLQKEDDMLSTLTTTYARFYHLSSSAFRVPSPQRSHSIRKAVFV